MAYIKCRWYEPAYQSEDRGIIPAVWLEEHGRHQIVRWPPWSQYQQPYETAQLPEADWKIFLLIEILSNAGTESDCDILIEYTSKDEERQPRQKRRKITDFMTTEEYGGCAKSSKSTGFPPSPFGKPISVTSDLQVLMEQVDLPVDLNGASDTDQSEEPKPSTSTICASDNAGSIGSHDMLKSIENQIVKLDKKITKKFESLSFAIAKLQKENDIGVVQPIIRQCGTKADLEELEIKLDEADFDKSLRSILQSVGGTTVRLAIFRMLHRTMSTSCAYHYNVSGKQKSEKENFRNLKLNALIIDCARTKQGFNYKDADTAIADWLRQAGNSYMKANKK